MKLRPVGWGKGYVKNKSATTKQSLSVVKHLRVLSLLVLDRFMYTAKMQKHLSCFDCHISPKAFFNKHDALHIWHTNEGILCQNCPEFL